MTDTILLVGRGPLTDYVQDHLQTDQTKLLTKRHQLTTATAYTALPPHLAAVVVTAGPADVDLVVTELATALQRAHVEVQRWVFVSAAGVNGEVRGNLEYPGVTDVREYFREQRYASKIIDETELPYTIFRPGRLVARRQGSPHLFNEGEPVPTGVVSYETITALIAAAIGGKYANQSLAVVETETEAL
ncbi:SDR family oxidoreductase [Fructilactobacillus ixorae]|uniref:SDR family oxidoreductase n=1 Tax=Fructilactobacillus ixorae TaxID=1750535 RepID=A0ABY5C569_9LACO|nr:NAD(P)-binding oxidoreductase [Fructilactobacillus ixorae]USS93270.1 SDR family oxidoreductase [Fructilactobacillus ixorae]